MALPSHKFSRERPLSWSWQFTEYWPSMKALEYVDVSWGVSYKEKNECLQVGCEWQRVTWDKKRKRCQDDVTWGGHFDLGQGREELVLPTKLRDWFEGDTLNRGQCGKVNELGSKGEDQKRNRGNKQEKEKFTECWRVNQRHTKGKEPRVLPLSSRSWEPQYVWICLFILG